MDVELQILKHLAREPHPTVGIIDEYYSDLSGNRLKQRRLNKLKKQLGDLAITLL